MIHATYKIQKGARFRVPFLNKYANCTEINLKEVIVFGNSLIVTFLYKEINSLS